MNPFTRLTVPLFCLVTCLAMSASGAGPTLDELQGKWSTTRTNRDGQTYTIHLDIQKDRLDFELKDGEGTLRMVAHAKLKVEQAGPVQLLTIFDIEGGRSKDDMSPVDDSRAMIYTLRDGALYLASNFDRERGSERPSLDVYRKTSGATSSASSSGATGADQILGTWKLEVVMGDNTRDYELRLSKTDGQLQGVLISPRSGERPCKSVTFKDGELVIEIVREINGTEFTMVYQAKLADGKLTGSAFAKGAEDQWKAEVRGSR